MASAAYSVLSLSALEAALTAKPRAGALAATPRLGESLKACLSRARADEPMAFMLAELLHSQWGLLRVPLDVMRDADAKLIEARPRPGWCLATRCLPLVNAISESELNTNPMPS